MRPERSVSIFMRKIKSYWKNINWNKLQSIIQIPIVAIMLVSTLLTYRMQQDYVVSSRKDSMPIIIFQVKTDPLRGVATAQLKNIGNGPAFNIHMTKIINRDFEVNFDTIPGIAQESTVNCEFEVYYTGQDRYVYSGDSLELYKFMHHLGRGFKSRAPGQRFNDVVISYTDILGDSYNTKQSLYFDFIHSKLTATVKEFPKP